MHDYKSLCAAAMISTTVVSIQTYIQTAFSSAYMNSSASSILRSRDRQTDEKMAPRGGKGVLPQFGTAPPPLTPI